MDRKINKVVRDIKSMKIRGAQEIAVEGLKVLREFAKEKGFGTEFTKAADKIINARPTGVSAYNAIGYVKKYRSLKNIDKVLKYLEKAKEWIAYNGTNLIKNGMIIMTHCHSSSVMAIFKRAVKEHKKFKVVVTETRPVLQGYRTAKELVKMGVPVYYTTDSAGALFINACNMLIVGTDAVKNDGVLNKIGTYPMALAARECGVPVYFVASKDKLDYDCISKIEDRPDREIGNPEELEKTGGEIENPAFDLTPWKLITAVVTESGILGRKEIAILLDGRFEV